MLKESEEKNRFDPTANLTKRPSPILLQNYTSKICPKRKVANECSRGFQKFLDDVGVIYMLTELW